jgi:glycosyltransferase involved in cell wall biosynthesis
VKLLIFSHACVTPINQEFFSEVEQQTGWDLTLVAPSSWKSEYGVRHLKRWRSFDGQLIGRPVLASGNVPLHVYCARLAPIFREVKPDAVYVHHEPYGAATAQIYWTNAQTIEAPIGFFTWQNIQKEYPIPFRYTEQWVYRQSAFAISGSVSARDVLHTKGYDGPLDIAPAGIDPTIFFRRNPDPLVRTELGARDSDLLVGFVGRLVPEKGLLTLMEALARCRDLPIQLALIGDGPQAHELDRRARDLNLQDRLIRRGYVPHTDIARYLASFDVLTIPSETQPNWKEQFGRVIIEAMATGTPVLGSNSGEIPHLIERTGGGWSVPERSADALASRLRHIANMPEERIDRADAGHDYVHANYTHAVLARSFADTIRNAVHSPAPA